MKFVQDNHSPSKPVGMVRGLHYQSPPEAQDKLVLCGAGVVFDVRVGSPTYGDWVRMELSAEDGWQLLIPKGFLHGFVIRAPDVELLYKCSDVDTPDCDGADHYADPDLALDWRIDAADVILSPKDTCARRFAGFKSPFVYEG